jgi:TetR/AcrR family transcriptional repressor of lmrAB and yxaGH operons
MTKQKITRDELVARAAKVFRKKGYYNTTMNDIGTICGLLKGSVYHYFQSKEELMLEVLKTSYKEAGDNIFPLAYNKNIPPHERLFMMLDIPEAGLFGNGTEDGGCLFGRIGLEIGSLIPEFSEVIKAHFNAYMEAYETIFAESVDGERAKELARQAIVEMQGAILLSVIYSDSNYYAEAKQRIMNYLS